MYLVQEKGLTYDWVTTARTTGTYSILQGNHFHEKDIRVAATNRCGTSYSPHFTLDLRPVITPVDIARQRKKAREVAREEAKAMKKPEVTTCKKANRPFPEQILLEDGEPGSASLVWPEVEGAEMYLVQIKRGRDWTKEAMTLDSAWMIKGFPSGEVITVRVASLN